MGFPRLRLLVVPLFLAACSKPGVVVYCAADQPYAEPIFRAFEEKTGLRVQAVFDLEASKTVGLVQTLFEERRRPRCDVFWNNELGHTIRLKDAGLLQPYRSPEASSFPAAFVDPDGAWTAFAARARVLVVNAALVPEGERPSSLLDLANPRWKGRTGIARPVAGTTLTHFAALFEAWGDERASAFCRALLENDVNLAAGNGPVASLVGEGELAFGLTDTDDVEAQRRNGKPVVAVFPDQEGFGTLVVPNSVALIAGAPHPENGKRLIDFLLAPEVERRLAFSPSANIPVRPEVEAPPTVRRLADLRRFEVDLPAVSRRLDERLDRLKDLFLR